ncbi:CDP-alcohol phosphatidyltransferase [Rhodobacteraceae bacterium WD3A24]|nr:CDP-alcohol phosphatidyltransferase [Rhodobacteraceae bacterium WD3A24]
MLAALARTYPHGRLGLGNLVTLVRAALVAVLAGLLIGPGAPAGPSWAALALAGMALALDGADGWAARRAGLVSRFGARFDMEVDVALALVLALLAWQSGKAGVWVLGLGLMRHTFLLAGLLWPALRAPLPDSRLRKGVCVVQIGVLTALLAPPLTPPLSQWTAAGALALLGLSFARDVAWLMRGGARR